MQKIDQISMIGINQCVLGFIAMADSKPALTCSGKLTRLHCMGSFPV